MFGTGHGPSGINFDRFEWKLNVLEVLINISRYEDIPVEATGTDVPKGIDTFDDVDLTPIIKVTKKNLLFL